MPSEVQISRICETSRYDVSENPWILKPHMTEPHDVANAFEHFRACSRGEEPPYPDHIELPPPKTYAAAAAR
jgi:hypothetical protein